MNRRSFSSMAVALFGLPLTTLAQESSQGSSAPQLPYREVPREAEDSKKVLIFISLTCPVCAAYHEQIAKWALSLPKGWSAEFVPVVEAHRDTVIAARAFYAAKALNATYLPAFLSYAYSAIQDRGMPVSDGKTWSFIASSSHLQGFDAAWKNVNPATVQAAFNKLIRYRIDATPSIAIGGRYVITPDSTNGDQELFFKLANGMVSKAMTG
ncbi:MULTISPECIES: thioredoxin domain-containing protein [unclassified Cupriavidus]|uniref:thioredoxin domain-containing protein n=1 Tax=unclassified Cupriavidus TaxID=2640874 RepID=UPI001CED3E68|nr:MULTISPECIES: thioredoxin domain-containing protein [unclassified Cupriavidus]